VGTSARRASAWKQAKGRGIFSVETNERKKCCPVRKDITEHERSMLGEGKKFIIAMGGDVQGGGTVRTGMGEHRGLAVRSLGEEKRTPFNWRGESHLAFEDMCKVEREDKREDSIHTEELE